MKLPMATATAMRALLGGDATADTVYLLVPGGCRKVTPPDILAYCPTISQSRIADWGATGSGRHASPRCWASSTPTRSARSCAPEGSADRTSAVEGTRVSVREDLGGAG